jgi:gamma-glutamylcyclotransferase (GGCT)/AIG2-like uncharacterized protein YtfP
MNIFTYGSLMYPSVFEALTEIRFEFEDIALKDYERRAITGKKYPGIRHLPGASVNGRLWLDIDESSLTMLDLFEDSLYERRAVELTSKSGTLLNAYAYVVPISLEHTLAAEDWDSKIFEELHLNSYVGMCGRFRSENLTLLS